MNSKLLVSAVVAAIVATFTLGSPSTGEAKADKNSVTISSSNTLVLNSVVSGESVAAIMLKAKELDAALSGTGLKEKLSGKKPLYLYLYSPGGSVESGLELIEALKGLGRPVHTITAFAASMAFQIAQNLDDRIILSSGTLMSHHAAGPFEGSFGGVPTQLESRIKFWQQRVRELDEQTVKRTKGKQTYESYTKEYDHEMWLTGTQSVKEGYADEVLFVKCDSTLSGVTTHQVLFMGLDLSYDLDNCPLNSSPMNIRISNPNGIDVLNPEVVARTKTAFLAEHEAKQKQVVPMYW